MRYWRRHSWETPTDVQAAWTSDDFFVPLSLWGSGLGGNFLQLLLEFLRSQGIHKCTVEVKGPNENGASRAQWDARLGFFDFYRAADFSLEDVQPYREIWNGREENKGRSALLSRYL